MGSCEKIKGYSFRGFKSMGLEFDIYQTKLWNQFFSFQLKVWHWIIKMIETYYKNGDCAQATYRA